MAEHQFQLVRAGQLVRRRTWFDPTCDSWECLPVSYDLPEVVAEGDWIVFEATGAYAGALRTRFNGMGHAKTLICSG